MEHEFELEREQKYGDVELKTKNFSRLKFICTAKDPETGKDMEKIILTLEVDLKRVDKYKDLFNLEQGQLIGVRIVEPSQTALTDFD